MPPYGASVLVAGSSGSGKSTLADRRARAARRAGLPVLRHRPRGRLRRRVERRSSLGDAAARADVDEEVAALLDDPTHERRRQPARRARSPIARARSPGSCRDCSDLRARTGRPHWLVIDEAHHLLPGSIGARAGADAAVGWRRRRAGHRRAASRWRPPCSKPRTSSSPSATTPIETMAEFARVIGESAPELPPPPAADDSPGGPWALVWDRRAGEAPVLHAHRAAARRA